MANVVPMPANSNKPTGDDPEVEGSLTPVLARAEAAIADLAKDYANWALADVAKGRAALEAATVDTENRGVHIEALFRVAHDLKGQGSSFGYPLITKIGHGLCSLTRDRALDYQAAHLDLAKSHLDAMHLILTKGIKGEGKVGLELAAKLEQKVHDLIG